MTTETARPFAGRFRMLAVITALAPLAFSTVLRADDGCEGYGEYSYLCGPVNAEDLVLIPGTKWIIASGFGGGVSLYLIDSGRKTWAEFYPTEEPHARQDMATYGACPGSPDPDAFVAHGLSIRPGADGRSTLYVVGHGEREAIEVFEVDASGGEPLLTWTGCVMTPDGMEANSVASFADGSLVATIPRYPGIRINEIFGDKPSGAVYGWSPGDDGFSNITMALEAGSELWVGTFAGDRIAYRDLQRGEKQ